MLQNEWTALKAALVWHMDAGADWAMADMPQSYLGQKAQIEAGPIYPDVAPVPLKRQVSESPAPPPVIPLGRAESEETAIRLALAATTLDDIKQAIAEFDGIGLKDTATNLVFADGNPQSGIMLIGDVPGAQDDRSGIPLSGEDGLWLDRALAAAGLDRKTHIYSTTLLNWRPPGNRTPNEAELRLSLPFIERHIQLVRPKILILCGGLTAKVLLGRDDPFSRLRGVWHDYSPQNPALRAEAGSVPIPAMVTHHPDSLGKTPAQKRGFWGDILKILEKKSALDLS